MFKQELPLMCPLDPDVQLVKLAMLDPFEHLMARQSVAVTLSPVERRSGHAGSCGVKTATHLIAMKIGKPVFKLMAQDGPNVIASDCPMAGHPIAQGIDQASTPAKALSQPLSLLRHAYGLDSQAAQRAPGRTHCTSRTRASRARSRPARSWCPTATTGRRRCGSSAPIHTSACANWRG